MCGISAILSTDALSDTGLIEQMTDVIKHRGPDGYDYYKSDHVHFGHRRLSILDLSNSGKQPMMYGDYVITYNGEVYNYKELRSELEKFGYVFRSSSDTEVVLASYVEWGEACVERFNGMWAFVIYDLKNSKVFISRDRFGIKPLFYTSHNGNLIIASEIKQFKTLPEWRSILNHDRAYDFLIYGYLDHTEETLFQDVFRLLPGHNMTYNIDLGSFKISCFYDLDHTANAYLSSDQLAEECYLKLFRQSVDIRLRSDVKVGSALSGGLDSSAIVGCIAHQLKGKETPESQETVSYISAEPSLDESIYIDEVCNMHNVLSHKVNYDFQDTWELLDRILYYQDEPFTSTSIIAQYKVFEKAKEKGLIVMLDGQGADEIIGGYSKFYIGLFTSLIRNKKWWQLLKESYFYNIYHAGGLISKVRRLVNRRKRSHESIHPNWFNAEILNLRNRYYQKKEDSMKNVTLGQLYGSGLQFLLRYEDRNSMAHSIESRVPFLDYNLVEYTYHMPDSLKINNGVRKFLLRKSLISFLPKLVLNRMDKIGFATPQDSWMLKEKDMVIKNLQETIDVSKGLVGKEIITEFEEYCDSYNGNKSSAFFWRALVFGKWMKLNSVAV